MNCSDVRDLLSPMTDREVAADEFRAVEEHLRTCRDCAFESTMIVGLKRLLGKWEGVRASERFRTRVLDRVRREPEPSRASWRPFARYAAVGALLGLAVLVAVAVLRPDGGGLPGAGVADARGEGPEGTLPGAAGRGVDAEGAGRLSADPVAQVLERDFAVRIARPGSVPSLASGGDVLKAGHSIRTSAKASVELSLVAGFRMRLEPGAEFAFQKPRLQRPRDITSGVSNGRRTLQTASPTAAADRLTGPTVGGGPCKNGPLEAGFVDGELRAGIAVFRGPAGRRGVRPFTVRSGGALVRLEDGDLLLELARREGGGLRVLVADGSVTVRTTAAGGVHEARPRGREVAVGAGEAMEIGPDGAVALEPRLADPGEVERLRARRWKRLR